MDAERRTDFFAGCSHKPTEAPTLSPCLSVWSVARQSIAAISSMKTAFVHPKPMAFSL